MLDILTPPPPPPPIGPSTQTDVEISAAGINSIVEFQGGDDSPDSITVTFDITDDLVALENIESYVVGLTIEGNPEGVAIGMVAMTTVNVLDDDGECNIVIL